jgi:hypothetical protein
MLTLKGLIRTHNVKAVAEYGDHYNEDFPNSTSWDVTLKYQGRQMTVAFYTGSAITKEQDAEEVPGI